jgi:hypothetical protein
MVIPDGFVTLTGAVEKAVRMAAEHDYDELHVRQEAYDGRPIPARSTSERFMYDAEGEILITAQVDLDVAYRYEDQTRLQEWWAWLRQELFLGSLESRNYSASGDLLATPKEFWGSKAAEYAYIADDMSVAGTRPAYGLAFVAVPDLDKPNLEVTIRSRPSPA